jgi:hypothetical protein
LVALPGGNINRLVGIFGTGRNGSTLLSRLLDSSPDLWVHPLELSFLSTFRYLGGRFSISRIKRQLRNTQTQTDGDRRQYYIDHFRPWVTNQLTDLESSFLSKLADPIVLKDNVHEEIAKRINSSVPETMAVFLEAVQAAYDDRQHPVKPLLAFKSIETKRLQEYNRFFAEMRFVHIIREPISNYASLKRTDMVLKHKPFWFQGGDILRTQIEDRWLTHAQFILEHGQAEPARHYLVRYEDLTKDPVNIVNDICQWLGIEKPLRAGFQTVLGGKTMTELPINASQPGVKTPAKVVANMAEQYGYEDVVTQRERNWISFRSGSVAERLGYANLGNSVPSRVALLGSWLPLDDWERMNATSRLLLLWYAVRRRFYIVIKLLSQ